jgi:spoIIIJ-associated protein
MKKIEAPTLADAYEKAAQELSCSITELRYEVIQHPSSGVLGMFKKSAIIVAECHRESVEPKEIKKIQEIKEDRVEEKKSIESIVAEEIIEEVLQIDDNATISHKSEHNIVISKEIESPVKKRYDKDSQVERVVSAKDSDAVIDSFFETKTNQIQERPKNNNIELADEIEKKLIELFSYSCFDIDTVEVDVVEDTALIFIDGDDAALLIGKEGYRYNAISYMLFNWLHSKYDLYIKLEIAQFITTQQEMIKNHIKPVIEYVEINGRGKTRPLDGILVQIALEQLREVFPNKYVAIKTGRDGRKFVIINEFNSKNHE